MSPYVSWGIILTIVSAYVVYSRVNKPQKKEDVIIQKGSAILGLAKDSGTESTEKKKKKKKPAKKAAKPEATPEPTPVSTPKEEKKEKAAKKKQQQPKKAQKAAPVVQEDSSESEDEAVEEDAATMARHLAQFRAGGKSPVPPAAAAQSNGSGSEKPKSKGKKSKVAEWSQGSDADAEEERFGSSTNPSDMLEAETGGPGVLRITPSQQPPRPQKQQRASSTQSTEGIHANKNQKKRERQKAARAEELRQQELARERYRAEQRAEAAKGPAKPQPVNALAGSSAWADSNKTDKAVKKSPSTGLLDTFEPTTTTTTTTSSSTSFDDGSVWESIPAGLVDDGWQEVATKKKPVKESTEATASEEESAAPVDVAPAEVSKPKARDVATIKKELSKNRNAFAALSDSASEWQEVNGWETEVSR